MFPFPPANQAFRDGVTANSERRYSDAFDAFTRAIAICDAGRHRGLEYARLYVSAAVCALALGDHVVTLHRAELAVTATSELDQSVQLVQRLRGRCELLVAKTLSVLGRTTEGIVFGVLAAERLERAKDEDYIPSLVFLGKLCIRTGEFQKGLEFLARAESCIAPSSTSDPTEDEGHIAVTKANLNFGLRRVTQAASCYRTRIAILERRCGSVSATVAENLVAYSRVLREFGDVTGAVSVLRRATAILERLGMQNTRGFVHACSVMALVLTEFGDATEAMALNERAIEIQRRLVPHDHPDWITSFNVRAALLIRLDRPLEAEAAGYAALAISRRSQTACAGPGCSRKLREDGAPLDVCVKCRRTCYCGKACQTADWKREGGHKAECKALIAATKAAARANS